MDPKTVKILPDTWDESTAVECPTARKRRENEARLLPSPIVIGLIRLITRPASKVS